MMTQDEIDEAVKAITAMRPDAEGKKKQRPCRLLEVDRVLRDLELERLMRGDDEFDILGVNLTVTDHRYTSSKQVEAARKAHPSTYYAQFQHPQ